MTKTSMKTQENQPTMNEDHMAEVAESLKVKHNDVSFNATKCKVAYIDPVNERELTSIYALLAYVAHNQNVRQDTVQMIVEAEFGVDDVSKIRRNDYMNAVEFLVDLKMDEIIN